MPAYSFYGCSSIKNVTLGKNVKTIGKRAFENCTSLKSITIPDSVTSIGCCAFAWCTNLTDISIPKSVKIIEDGAFGESWNIKNVYITDVYAWCNIEFSGDTSNPLFNGGNLFLNNEFVSKLVIPNNVVEIKNYTFYGSNLIDITIPYGVTSIRLFCIL